ncbi:MAG: hypothetical protein ACOCZE_00415 [Planctomycetota bacterium]
MIRTAAILCLAALAGGCGGDYILTAPDQLAPAGKEATVVTRLQRNDFFVLALPVEEAAMTYRAGDLPERGAYTDELGYAGTVIPAPEKPGLYDLRVAHLDVYGDLVEKKARLFVWPADKPLVAVDLDSLPWEISGQSDPAAKAIAAVGDSAGVIYLTRQESDQHQRLHDWLAGQGYPAGPILLWQHKKWHIVQGSWRIPKIVIEDKMVSRLPEVKKAFANLDYGITSSSVAAGGFAQAGLRPVIIGGAGHDGPALRRANWEALEASGLESTSSD